MEVEEGRVKLVLRGPQFKKKADRRSAQSFSRVSTLEEEVERTQGKLGLKGSREVRSHPRENHPS